MIYLISGENTFETEQQVDKLVASFEGEVEKVDGDEISAEQLPDLLAGVTLFSLSRMVVIKNASHNKSVWSALGEWLEKSVENDIVLVETKPDKRTKTYKWLDKHADKRVFGELRSYEAERWLTGEVSRRKLDMPPESVKYMVDYVGVDQWRLASELDKLSLSGKPVNKELIDEIVEPTPQATSFELVDAAFRKKTELMNRIFETVSRQEDPYMFFGLIASQVHAIALMKNADGKSIYVVAKESGANAYVLEKVEGLATMMSNRQIKAIVSRLAELDANIKSRGVDPWVQIRSFLNSL